MKAVKDNKEYSIDASQERDYASQGYDIYEEDGTIIKYGVGKKVSYEKHKALEEDYKELENKYKSAICELEELKTEEDSKGKSKDGKK